MIDTADDPRPGSAAPSKTSGEPAPVRRLPHSGASVHAGEQLTRGKYGVRSTSESGTAGLIVRKKGAASGRFVLTCAHVLGMPAIGEGQQLIDANAVYAPHLSHFICDSCEYDHPIGSVVGSTLPPTQDHGVPFTIPLAGANYGVDASLIELKPTTGATNKVPEIGEITAVRDLIGEWTPTGPAVLVAARQLAVRKFGATTDFTQGKLVEIVAEPIIGGGGAKGLLLEVESTLKPGESPPSKTYKLDMARCKEQLVGDTPAQVAAQFAGSQMTAVVGGPADAPTITVTGKNFSEPGDSGSPVVDDAGKVIGILRSGTAVRIFAVDTAEPIDICIGRTQVVFIRAAMELLGVELLPPGVKAAGDQQAAPGMLLQRAARRPIDRGLLDLTRARLERTPLGARLSELGQRHFPEVRELVHHHRRVKVAWHRYQGPGFVNAFVAAMQRPGWPVPREVGGVRLDETLRVMRDVLNLYGSPGLRAAIAEYESEILSIVERTAAVEDLARELGPPALRLLTAHGVPGSAAAVVADDAGVRYLLTAYHVAFGAGGAAGDRVYAVPDEEGDPADAVPIGTVARGVIGRFGAGESFVDAALVELTSQPRPAWLLAALAALPVRPADGLQLGDSVSKEGPATRTTLGVVLDPAYHDHPVIDGRRFSAPNQLLIGSAADDLLFCAAGDSGAAVLDAEGHLAGLLWGSTESGVGLATPAGAVLAALEVTLASKSTVDKVGVPE